ncbi:MAG: DnaJ domain-containing protein [Deltaproteobacteria bacterium]|nr:DnaJ domain-containing protein [Deltaproteobacteria bacterium]
MITEHEARAVLRVPRGARPRELRRAFRRRVLDTHPDRHPGDAGATRRLMRVVAAYERLRLGPPRASAAPEAPPAVTRPSRYRCPRCEDSFEIRGGCARCELPLWDSFGDGQRPATAAEPAVERLIERLERSARLRTPRIEPARLPYYVSAALFSAGLAIAASGPVSPGVAIASYGAALGALALFSDARLRQLAARFE